MSTAEVIQPRKRGRPAKLSREAILEAGLRLLMEGAPELSISAVARELKTTPMSLYTHVENVDDLVNGVSNLALARINFDIDTNLPLEKQAQLWLVQLHEQMVKLPQLVGLLGQSGTFPSEWLSIHAVLFRILIKIGFKEEVLVNTSRWFGQSVISNILINHRGGEAIAVENELEGIVKALNELNEQDRAFYMELLPTLSIPEQSPFEFEVERMMVALTDLINREVG